MLIKEFKTFSKKTVVLAVCFAMIFTSLFATMPSQAVHAATKTITVNSVNYDSHAPSCKASGGFEGICANQKQKSTIGTGTYTCTTASKAVKAAVWLGSGKKLKTVSQLTKKQLYTIHYAVAELRNQRDAGAYSSPAVGSEIEALVKQAKNYTGEIPENYEFYIGTKGGAQDVIFWRLLDNPKIRVHKTSSDSRTTKLSSYTFEGIKFKFSQSSSFTNAKTVVIKSGSYTPYIELEPGKWYVKEYYVTGSGYKLNSTVKTITIHPEESKTVEFENKPAEGTLVLDKRITRPDGVKISNGVTKKGFKFTLTSLENSSLKYSDKTDENGDMRIEGILAGKYKLTETIPDGLDEKYKAITKAQTVTIAPDGTLTFEDIATENKYWTNESIQGEILLKKIITKPDGKASSESLKGFNFSFTQKDAPKYTYSGTTNANGEIHLKNVPVGKYSVKENLTAEQKKKYGSVTISPQTITVKETKAGVTKVTWENRDLVGAFDLNKKITTYDGKSTTDPLSGFKFVLTNKEDATKKYSGVTDTKGYLLIKNIAVGTYTLTEEMTAAQAAKYTAKIPSQTVVISANETTHLKGDFIQPQKVGNFHLDKSIFSPSGNKATDSLAGFKFTLTNTADPKKTYSGTTNINGDLDIKNIPVGTYKVEEDLTAEQAQKYISITKPQNINIEADKTYTFKDSANGKTYWSNNQKPGSFTMQKKIFKDGGQVVSDEPLEGFKFVLKKKGSSAVYKSAVTTENGKITITDIEPGTYTLSEQMTKEQQKKYRAVSLTQDITIEAGENEIFIDSKYGWAYWKQQELPHEYFFYITKSCANGRLDGFNFKAELIRNNEVIATEKFVTDEDGLTWQDSNIAIYNVGGVKLEKNDTIRVTEELTDEQAKIYEELPMQEETLTEELMHFNFEYENIITPEPLKLKKVSSDGNVEGIQFTLSGYIATNPETRIRPITKKTDENGEIDFGEIEVGRYVIEETGFDKYNYSSESWVAGFKNPAKEIVITKDDDNDTNVVEFENNKLNPVMTTQASDESGKSQIILADGTQKIKDKITYEDFVGGETVTVKGWLYDAATQQPLKDENGNTITKTINFEVPSEGKGTADMEFEVDASRLAGKKVVIVQKAYYGSKNFINADDLTDEAESVYFPEVKTTAKDKTTEDHYAPTASSITILDEVKYKSLQVGKEYTVKGKLVNKKTKEDIVVDGKPVTAEKTFTPEATDGSVTLEFTFDSTALAGETTVVFEDLYHEGILVGTHSDINDKNQEIDFPKIGTTALDEETREHYIKAESRVSVIDTVKYEKFVEGKYEFVGTLYDKETGEPLLINDKKVTQTVTKDIEDSDGDVTVTFDFNASELAGHTLVVYEEVYLYKSDDEKVLIAEHKDIESPDQSIYIPGIGTTAKDSETNTNVSLADNEITLIDTVNYKNLKVGHTYKVKGVLMEKKSGNEMLNAEGEKITSEAEFTAKEPDGSVDVTFVFDGSDLAGTSTVVFEDLYENNVILATHSDIDDEGQTLHVPEIGTTAKDSDTQDHMSYADEDVTIVDTIAYKNLAVGKEYRVSGVLMDKETGKALLVDGNPVTAEKTFTAKETDGSVDVEFKFSGVNLKGKTVVAFEDLYCNEKLVAVHANINDKGQEIDFPEIGTTAADIDTEDHISNPDEDVTIVDTVTYQNLIKGKEYKVSGVLMDKDTGEPILVDGKEVTAENTFTAPDTDGSVDVTFTFNGVNLSGKSVVVFENLYYNEKLVAAHTDINDEDQGIDFPNVKTTAKDSDTQDHMSYADDSVTIVDTVIYENLIAGKEYKVSGVLMDKDTGEPILVDKEEVTAENTFTATDKNGSVDIEFTFNGVDLKGKTVVAFENLYYKEKLIGVHADINDEEQSVHFSDIATMASDKDTRGSRAAAATKVTLIDTVGYTNLIEGTYKVKGVLMDKETGKELLVNGKNVSAETTLDIADGKPDGKTEVTFKFDGSNLEGHTLVVFEEIYKVVDGKESYVGDHKDITDKGQSIRFYEVGSGKLKYKPDRKPHDFEKINPPKERDTFNPFTGDNNMIDAMFILLILSTLLAALLLFRNRRRSEEN